jgi:hypothetical protein
MSRGSGPISLSMNDQSVLTQLRRMSPVDFEKLSDVCEGLHFRLFNTLKNARSADEAADLAKSKRYTHSRIRRILINAYLGITSKWEKISPPYIKVLAFNKTGRELLREMKTKCRIPVIIKPADAPTLWTDTITGDETQNSAEVIRDLFETEVLATDLYMLASPSSDFRKAGFDLLASPAYIQI